MLGLGSVAFPLLFIGTVSHLGTVVFGLSGWFDYLMLVLWVAVGLTVVMRLLTPVVWARRYWSLLRRLHYMLLLVGGGAFVWWLA